MLDLEKYTKKCERAGLYEINFDQHYTAIYSRLYLIQIALENQTNAAKYYQLAKEHWQKFNLEDKTHLPQSIDQQIKGVDRYFERPAWRTGSD